MRRTLAGFLFALSYAALCLAAGGWLLQRTVLDPEQTADAADEILADKDIRQTLTTLISEATASSLGRSEIEVEALVNSVLDNPQGATIISSVLQDAHARMIGELRAPVFITAKELVQIVRHEAVGELDPIVVKVPEIAILGVARVVLRWAVPLAAIAAIVLFGLGLTAHPDRPVLLRSMGIGLIVLGLCVGIVGYLVPKFLVPLLTDSVWAGVPPVLADHNRILVFGLSVLLIAGGAALIASAGMMRQQRRWSTPINTYRYTEERRWG